MADNNKQILTTHTGSLPRPEDLIQIMWAKGDGIPVDQAALDERVASAVNRYRTTFLPISPIFPGAPNSLPRIRVGVSDRRRPATVQLRLKTAKRPHSTWST